MNPAREGPPLPLRRRLALGAVALLLASAIWLPLLHLFYRPNRAVLTDRRSVSPHARRLASRHLELWVDDELREKEQARMRRSDAEWDFMGRTFLVLAFANLCLREPDRGATYLRAMDAIIADTLAVEREKGKFHFLMDYAGNRSFVQKPARSLFLDGEIALMLGARRVIAEHPLHKKFFVERTELIARRLASSPVLCGESYPDECWMFCNAAALASLRMSEYLDGSDHGAFLKRWLARARAGLTDEKTGLLISSFTYDGRRTIDGPGGSSIWFTSHCLRLVDESFARDQYERARRKLGVTLLGFSYAREWPSSHVGPIDVDSGPVIPILEVSAGSSGLAFVAAASFGDEAFLTSLLTTLDYAAFPLESGGRLKYCASNQVGDAVLLYSLVLGPLWERIISGGKRP